MFSDGGRTCRRSMFTMIELMIVVIIVGILAAAAVPLYQGAVRRAYESEISSALGSIRTAQRAHLVEHGEYAPADTTAEFNAIGITAGDFQDMQYAVAPGDEGNFASYFEVTVSGDDNEEFTATWTPRDVYGTPDIHALFNNATIDQTGAIEYDYK